MDFKNLKQLEKKFRTNEDCLAYYEAIRWMDGVSCPHCGSDKFYALSKEFSYKCKDKECAKRFNVLTKTIFENTKIPLPTWFTAIYIATSHKKGISSVQLAKDLGLTQKTAWFILHKIREMLKQNAPYMVDSVVEIDETYVGAKSVNLHAKKRKELKQGRGPANKTPVFAILERNGSVYTEMVERADRSTLNSIINKHVDPSTTIITDGYPAYNQLKQRYNHEIVQHQLGEYVRGSFHTNGIEGFFAQLKRGIYGIYHHVSPTYLHRYCSEFAFRYNTRKQDESERFRTALEQNLRKVLYKDVKVSKEKN